MPEELETIRINLILPENCDDILALAPKSVDTKKKEKVKKWVDRSFRNLERLKLSLGGELDAEQFFGLEQPGDKHPDRVFICVYSKDKIKLSTFFATLGSVLFKPSTTKKNYIPYNGEWINIEDWESTLRLHGGYQQPVETIRYRRILRKKKKNIKNTEEDDINEKEAYRIRNISKSEFRNRRRMIMRRKSINLSGSCRSRYINLKKRSKRVTSLETIPEEDPINSYFKSRSVVYRCDREEINTHFSDDILYSNNNLSITEAFMGLKSKRHSDKCRNKSLRIKNKNKRKNKYDLESIIYDNQVCECKCKCDKCKTGGKKKNKADKQRKKCEKPSKKCKIVDCISNSYAANECKKTVEHKDNSIDLIIDEEHKFKCKCDKKDISGNKVKIEKEKCEEIIKKYEKIDHCNDIETPIKNQTENKCINDISNKIISPSRTKSATKIYKFCGGKLLVECKCSLCPSKKIRRWWCNFINVPTDGNKCENNTCVHQICETKTICTDKDQIKYESDETEIIIETDEYSDVSDGYHTENQLNVTNFTQTSYHPMNKINQTDCYYKNKRNVREKRRTDCTQTSNYSFLKNGRVYDTNMLKYINYSDSSNDSSDREEVKKSKNKPIDKHGEKYVVGSIRKQTDNEKDINKQWNNITKAHVTDLGIGFDVYKKRSKDDRYKINKKLKFLRNNKLFDCECAFENDKCSIESDNENVLPNEIFEEPVEDDEFNETKLKCINENSEERVKEDIPTNKCVTTINNDKLYKSNENRNRLCQNCSGKKTCSKSDKASCSCELQEAISITSLNTESGEGSKNPKIVSRRDRRLIQHYHSSLNSKRGNKLLKLIEKYRKSDVKNKEKVLRYFRKIYFEDESDVDGTNREVIRVKFRDGYRKRRVPKTKYSVTSQNSNNSSEDVWWAHEHNFNDGLHHARPIKSTDVIDSLLCVKNVHRINNTKQNSINSMKHHNKKKVIYGQSNEIKLLNDEFNLPKANENIKYPNKMHIHILKENKNKKLLKENEISEKGLISDKNQEVIKQIKMSDKDLKDIRKIIKEESIRSSNVLIENEANCNKNYLNTVEKNTSENEFKINIQKGEIDRNCRGFKLNKKWEQHSQNTINLLRRGKKMRKYVRRNASRKIVIPRESLQNCNPLNDLKQIKAERYHNDNKSLNSDQSGDSNIEEINDNRLVLQLRINNNKQRGTILPEKNQLKPEEIYTTLNIQGKILSNPDDKVYDQMNLNQKVLTMTNINKCINIFENDNEKRSNQSIKQTNPELKSNVEDESCILLTRDVGKMSLVDETTYYPKFLKNINIKNNVNQIIGEYQKKSSPSNSNFQDEKTISIVHWKDNFGTKK